MDELLAKYMLGEATPQEQEAVTQWIEENEANRKYFDHFKLIWDTSSSLKTESKLDPDESWAEFRKMVDGQKPDTAKVRPLTTTNRWIKIAAMWLVILGSAALLYTLFRPVKVNQLTLQTTEIVKTYVLPDGSAITLNKNSVLTYPEKFTGNVREVKLKKGEAFFNVAHNKDKPFIIGVDDVRVKVLGTSFNIKNAGKAIQVIVETGVVQVSRKKVVIRLKPKERVDIDSGSGLFRKSQTTDELYNYYRTQVLVANNTPLWRVVQVLNEVYDVNIVIDDRGLANRPLTTTFKTNSLDSTLKIISGTFNVHIIRKPNKIIIQ